jgi:hypothetical protein
MPPQAIKKSAKEFFDTGSAPQNTRIAPAVAKAMAGQADFAVRRLTKSNRFKPLCEGFYRKNKQAYYTSSNPPRWSRCACIETPHVVRGI